MKKIYAVVFAAVLSASVFCMTACGEDIKNSSELSGTPVFSSDVSNPFETSDAVSADEVSAQNSENEVSEASEESSSNNESSEEQETSTDDESSSEPSEKESEPVIEDSEDEDSEDEDSEDEDSEDEDSEDEDSEDEDSEDEDSEDEDSEDEDSEDEDSEDEDSEDEDSEDEEPSESLPEGKIIKAYVGNWKSGYDLSSFSESERQMLEGYLSEVSMEIELFDDGTAKVISYYYDQSGETAEGEWCADGKNVYIDIMGDVANFVYSGGKLTSESMPYMYFTKA